MSDICFIEAKLILNNIKEYQYNIRNSHLKNKYTEKLLKHTLLRAKIYFHLKMSIFKLNGCNIKSIKKVKRIDCFTLLFS